MQFRLQLRRLVNSLKGQEFHLGGSQHASHLARAGRCSLQCCKRNGPATPRRCRAGTRLDAVNQPRVPESGALPNMPSLTLPEIESPSTVAENSRVSGIGLVMSVFQPTLLPLTVPS